MLKIKNSAEFVRQLLKTTSIQYRIFPEREKWTGGGSGTYDLNSLAAFLVISLILIQRADLLARLRIRLKNKGITRILQDSVRDVLLG